MTPPKLTMRPSRFQERKRAIELFREWDAVMVKHHGELYYRAMRYTLH